MSRDPRPTNVGIGDLLTFRWPIVALASIVHRIAGVVLFIGIGFGLYALDVSLSSEAGFESVRAMLVSLPGKFIAWCLLSALAYHFVAGIKHLLMDLGLGETLRGGKIAATISVLISLMLMALAALWLQ